MMDFEWETIQLLLRTEIESVKNGENSLDDLYFRFIERVERNVLILPVKLEQLLKLENLRLFGEPLTTEERTRILEMINLLVDKK